MQYKFNKHLSDILPLSAGKIKILVAVSGGADSMCLLELLRNTTLDIEIEIAHVNFHLRGEESDMDESTRPHKPIQRWCTAAIPPSATLYQR